MAAAAAQPECAEAAASIVALVQAMQLPRVILMGHGWGSLIALAAAAQFGERISHLVLIGTASPMAVARRCWTWPKRPGASHCLDRQIQPQPRHPG